MMEETANPSTIAPEMPTTANEKSNPTSINLLIKASNQQFDDQVIESDLMWTVYRLKTQLSLVYPSKPPVSEQKLIYSGQLLNDCAQLKDIIRSYKDVYTQNHILHLVYTPKNQSLPKPQKSTKMTANSSGSSNTDGLRQRQNVTTNPNSSSSSSNINATNNTNRTLPQQAAGLQQAAVNSNPLNAFASNNLASSNNSGSPYTGGFDMQTLALQQTAMYNWMWQTYAQYMQQIQNVNVSQMPATGSSNNTTNPTNPFNPVIAFPSLAPAAFFAQPYFTQQNQILTPNSANAAQRPDSLQAQQQQQQQQQQQPEAEAAPAQPRFLNIVQEEQEHRDWLDSFFSIMRMALFLTILYFNSSAIRCLMVFLIAGGIYLYHIGIFRSRRERNNNNINRNNNAAAGGGGAAAAAAGAEPVQPVGQLNQDQQPQNDENNELDNDSTDAGSSSTATNSTDAASIAAQDAAATVDNNSTSVIAFMRSFIVSFFTSLLPETPAAL